MTRPDNPIERNFELAAERCEDLTPLVYRRLHSEHPETVAMFRTEGSELVKGSMLALTIEAMLDFAGERKVERRGGVVAGNLARSLAIPAGCAGQPGAPGSGRLPLPFSLYVKR